MTPREIADARRRIGEMWGLGRDLTWGELARCLEMEPSHGSHATHHEIGRNVERRSTGPQRVAIRAMLAGFIPENAPRMAFRRAG